MVYKEGHITLTIKGLKVFKDDECILKSTDMDIYRNDIVALVGPANCGKFAFLRALNQLFPPTKDYYTEGEVLLEGLNIEQMPVPQLRQQIGMLFEQPTLFPMTIYENMLFGLRLMNVKDKTKLNYFIRTALEEVHLWNEVKDRLTQSVAKLTTEQQQRLSLARTLTTQPKILLMDKPTLGLNSSVKGRFEEIITELRARYTVIITTEDKLQAGRISDRVAFFYRGALIEYDRTEAIFIQPKNALTESYITGRIR